MCTLNATEVHAVCYGISAFDSNAMKSPNPHSGIYIADTARTLDLNGGNPACNQGGVLILVYDCTRQQSK
jgi:DNA (cytosine-5)-methyltransferase 1